MRFHISCIALLVGQAAYSDAFLQRTKTNSYLLSHPPQVLSQAHQATAVGISQPWKDLHEFNMELDSIAEQCGSAKHPVISKAAACQELWENQLEVADSDIHPDTISFNTVLKAWNKCCSTLAEGVRSRTSVPSDLTRSVDVYTPRDAAKRATSLLLEHEEESKIDVASYNIVIDTWAKSRLSEAPEAAERLLKKLIEHDDLEPDTLSYNAVLDAWSKSGRDESLQKVLQIYRHMENLQEQGKDVKPTIWTVNVILNAHAKLAAKYTSPPRYQDKEYDKAAQCAEAALNLLQDTKKKFKETGDNRWKVDVTTYTIVMDVFSRCESSEATHKAEALLKELNDAYEETKDSRLRPNFRTYTTLLSAWSRNTSAKSPARVEEILVEMNQSPATRPNCRTYTSAIQCWAKSRDHDKAKRVLKLLLEMKERHKASGNDEDRPTMFTYNCAIDACARCQGSMEQQTEALKIAFAVFKSAQADDFVYLNQSTFSILLKAVSNLLPAGEERNKVATAVFDKAKKAGLVDLATVKNLRRCVDHRIMVELLDGAADKNGNFNYQDIPNAWTKNLN